MKVGDYSRVESDAIAQVAAGAAILDVNAGIPLADEPAILAEAIRRVQTVVDVPLSIDSSIVAALEAGLAAYQGKALVNSVTGEEERLESVLPLVAKYGAAVVVITNDENGINEDPNVRFEVAKMIVNRAADHGIGPEDIVVDPLVMPIGAIGSAGPPGAVARASPAYRVGRQHHLRRVQHQLRPAQPGHHQRRVPGHGGRCGPDLGHHQPAGARGPLDAARGGRAHRQRRELHDLDLGQSTAGFRGRRGTPATHESACRPGQQRGLGAG